MTHDHGGGNGRNAPVELVALSPDPYSEEEIAVLRGGQRIGLPSFLEMKRDVWADNRVR
jgi:hypothetical protein